MDAHIWGDFDPTEDLARLPPPLSFKLTYWVNEFLEWKEDNLLNLNGFRLCVAIVYDIVRDNFEPQNFVNIQHFVDNILVEVTTLPFFLDAVNNCPPDEWNTQNKGANTA